MDCKKYFVVYVREMLLLDMVKLYVQGVISVKINNSNNNNNSNNSNNNNNNT